MDPKDFGISTLPLQHEPYGPIKPERLAGLNKGKLAVVTGAGRGIGQAIAVALANSGANLALLDLSTEGQAETKSLCEKYAGVRAETFATDITDVANVRAVFKAIASTLGPVDILVNNAGVAHGKLASQERFEDFWRAIEINFKSTMLTIYEVLPGMRERRSGVIVNIASRAATIDMPTGLSYNSSKAAVARATSTLQDELESEGFGDCIHTYSLHPGGVWGAMVTGNTTPEVQKEIRHMFKDPPELCGNTVAFLATGQAKALRGHYFDCRQDIERVLSFGRETLRKHWLYRLTIKFLPGYENEP